MRKVFITGLGRLLLSGLLVTAGEGARALCVARPCPGRITFYLRGRSL